MLLQITLIKLSINQQILKSTEEKTKSELLLTPHWQFISLKKLQGSENNYKNLEKG